MDLATKNLSRLTFTRFIAALMVVAFHFGANTTPFDGDFFGGVFRQGPYAVQYFFFLSGFIMATVYATDAPEKFNRKKFWVARFARIYPVYLIGLALAATLTTPDMLTLALNVSLLQAWSAPHALSMNNPGWSLSVEVFFYAMFPALLFLLTRRNLIRSSVIAVALCFLHESLNMYLIHSVKNSLPINPIKLISNPTFPSSVSRSSLQAASSQRLQSTT
ncbi:acyltransferase family protein [Pseudomonas sp.]|uniref:acyltransferase family protein n=1 Tax=Pseudomonas sp. TaxID=306 RepID=UPI003F40082A